MNTEPVVFPDEMQRLIIDPKDASSHPAIHKIDQVIAALLLRIFRGETPREEEFDTLLLSPVEAAALLSIRSGKYINRRYLKERTRSDGVRHYIPDEHGTVHVQIRPLTPKLVPARIVGNVHLYRLRDVWDLGPIRQRKPPTGKEERRTRHPLVEEEEKR